MAVSSSEFPSSTVFDEIAAGLNDAATKKDFMKKANACFQFDLKNKAGKVQSFFVDLKHEGKVGQGKPAKKADVTLIMDDSTFGSLKDGKGNAQKLFMQGKIKIKGNMMLATKLGPLLQGAQTKAKL